MPSSIGNHDNGMKIQHFDDYEQQHFNKAGAIPHELEPVVEEEYIQDEEMDNNSELMAGGSNYASVKLEDHIPQPSISDMIQKPIYSSTSIGDSQQLQGNNANDMNRSNEDGKYLKDQRKKSAEGTS